MNQKELKLAADLLELASEEFANHGCNDLPEHFLNGWTTEEKQLFAKEYHEWNGDPDEYNPEDLFIPDDAIMVFLADKLKKQN